MSFVYLGTGHGNEGALRHQGAVGRAVSRQNAMQRLKREAALGMRLAHPNVCHIIRMGETQDGLVYVVMPFVEGEILSDRNNRKGYLPPGWRRRSSSPTSRTDSRCARAQDRASRPEAREHHDLQGCTGGERAVVMDFGLAKERRADAELQKLTATESSSARRSS